MKKVLFLLARLIIAIVFISLGVTQIMSVYKTQQVQSQNQSVQKELATSDLKSSYDQLDIGMSYEECVSIIGVEGELFSETETEYIGKTSVYLWTPKDAMFTGIEAYFNDGKLSSKTWVS